jgi:hypothetical protein
MSIYNPVKDRRFNDNHHASRYYVELLMQDEIRSKGYNPWGWAYEWVLEQQSDELEQIARLTLLSFWVTVKFSESILILFISY